MNCRASFIKVKGPCKAGPSLLDVRENMGSSLPSRHLLTLSCEQHDGIGATARADFLLSIDAL